MFPWWEALCRSLALIDISFPHVPICEFIRAKKRLVNNLHLKPPRSSALIGCRRSEREGLAELNRGSGLAVSFQGRAAQSGRHLRGVKPALKICCRKVWGRWRGADAEPAGCGSPGRRIQWRRGRPVAFLQGGLRRFGVGRDKPPPKGLMAVCCKLWVTPQIRQSFAAPGAVLSQPPAGKGHYSLQPSVQPLSLPQILVLAAVLGGEREQSLCLEVGWHLMPVGSV